MEDELFKAMMALLKEVARDLSLLAPTHQAHRIVALLNNLEDIERNLLQDEV